MAALRRLIDGLTNALGRAASWLTLAMMLVTCTVVLLRYGFDTGAIAAQESVVYMHALVFMLGASYALRHDAHVRVDFLYSRWSARRQIVTNLVGHVVFLLPFCVFVFTSSFDYVARSWRIREASQEVGGIPAIYLLKTLIPVMAALLFVQGVAEILRAVERLHASSTPRGRAD